ncbi:MAG: CapA family protein [Desulfobacteraceae bacterium]|jgi:poly-gamma-glutamate synthesis protein (capsule biosynthesis protein)
MDAHLNWQDGTWLNQPPRGPRYEICIASDWAPIRAFSRIILDDPEAVYGDLLPELRNSDLRIANLECPLTRSQSAVSKSGSVLKGMPEHIEGLTSVPFDIVTLANNHVFDYGLDGFQETLDLLNANHIKSVGAGMTRPAAVEPLIVRLGETTIALISFSEGEDLTGAVDGPGVFGWEVDTVVEVVRSAKSKADLVFVICHAGVEYIPFPPPYLARALTAIAEAGADLVAAHHPHVPQGVQIVGSVPVVYSLGNFVFHQPSDLIYRKVGYLLKVGISAGTLTGIKLVPYRIDDQGLNLLEGERLAWFMKKLKQVSRPLATMAGIEDAWNGFLRHYGVHGFFDEVAMLLDQLRNDPPKGAAMFRNRVATMQHREHWIDAMTRIIDGTIGEAPEWACDLVREWLTRDIQTPS